MDDGQELGERSSSPSFLLASDHNKTRLRTKRDLIKAYFMSPRTMIKDIILLSLAVPGLVAILNSGIVYDVTTATPFESSSNLAHLGSCNCGDSVAEARRLGCKYDFLASAWLPAQCRDEELSLEFVNSGDGPNGQWRYWYDQNHTKEIPADQLGDHADDVNFQFYSTTKWHVMHCFFYWRKQYRARYSSVIVEPRYDNELHINHCGGIFRSNPPTGVVSGIHLNSDYF